MIRKSVKVKTIITLEIDEETAEYLKALVQNDLTEKGEGNKQAVIRKSIWDCLNDNNEYDDSIEDHHLISMTDI